MARQLLIAVLLFCTNIALGQNPFYINYSIGEGMPTSNVYSVTQDEHGYMWFTTDVGIVKYDSHKFELFNTDNGLSDNEVFQMRKDSKGRYWIMTLNGKLSFLYKGKLYSEKNSALLKKITASSFVIDFYEDENHTLYFSYKNGDLITIKANNEVTRTLNKGIACAGMYKKGNVLYAFNGDGIYNFDIKKLVTPTPKKTPFHKIYHTNYGLFFNENNSLYKISDENTIRPETSLAENNEIINILAENPNKIWLCSRDGLFLYENELLKNQFFKGDVISAIYKDSENGYWLSTLNRGVIYIPSFDVFSLADTAKINCIEINAKKEIWFGGDSNDYYVKKGNVITKQILFKNEAPNRITKIRFFGDYTYVIGKTAMIQIDKNGKIQTNTGYADDIYRDEKYIYLGSSCAMRLGKNDFENSNLHDSDAILKRRTNAICKGKDKDIWFGTNYGLYRYNPKDSITNFAEKNKLLDTSIEDIFYDERTQNLFVASSSKGIIVLNNNKVINHFSTISGLNSNSCNKIQKISSSSFLIGTNNGLNLLEFKNEPTIKNLNGSIGLKNNKINDINYLEGTVYLASDRGLLFFSQNKIDSKSIKPKCVFVNLKNQDKIITDNFAFPFAKNDIGIQFNGISYINQGELIYYYRINKNQAWRISKESQINYQSLPAKKYKFEVYCQDELGNKSNIAGISFEILPPFWQKLWFILLSVILFIIILYFFIQFWLKRQKQHFEKEKRVIQIERDKANLEKQMIELEQKALRLQMNPHFIFNALNTIKGYYSEGDAVNASSYISKFSKLLRMLLENTEQVIPLSKEIEMLSIYIHLNKIRYKDKFDYELIVDEKLSTDEIAIPTLLLQPMVENAIIHGLSPKSEKGILTVSFKQKDNLLECIVEDNGIGRTASKSNAFQDEDHQSKALEITTERLNLFSQNIGKSNIEIIDLQDKDLVLGTKVIITIPLISIW